MTDEGKNDRTCRRCGKVFSFPAHLRSHQARKTPCDPILAARPEAEAVNPAACNCRFCGRPFTARVGMLRHIRVSCKIAPNAKNGNTGMEKLYEHTVQRQLNDLKAENAEIRAQNAEMMKMMRSLVQQQGDSLSLQLRDNNNVSVVAPSITIKVFGKEGLDHATADRIQEILAESLRETAQLTAAAKSAVLKTAMLVYSDPDHPENLTAYLPNKKRSEVLVHGTAGWEVRPAGVVLPPMATRSIDTLFERQPHEGAGQFGPLMKELRDNEASYTSGAELEPILVRNRDLLKRALDALPVAGREGESGRAGE